MDYSKSYRIAFSYVHVVSSMADISWDSGWLFVRINTVVFGKIKFSCPRANSFSDIRYDIEGQSQGGTSMKRAEYPSEIAKCFVFLACSYSSYVSADVPYPNGGVVIN